MVSPSLPPDLVPSPPSLELSVVVVTWNSEDMIGPCLRSIPQGCRRRSYEVIVVDNASGDRTTDVVSDGYPSTRLMVNSGNRGFAAACAQGIAAARGRHVMLLNPDTVVGARAIDRLADCLDEEPEIGLAGPRLVDSEGSAQRASARRTPKLAYAFYNQLRFHQFPRWCEWGDRRVICPYDLSRTQDVDSISGAAMLIRGDVIAALGPLDVGYRHTGEDVDYCLAAGRAGWRVRYVHDAEIRHHAGASSVQDIYRVTMDSVLSVHRYYRKNWSAGHALTYRVMIVLGQVPATIAGGVAAVVAGREPISVLAPRLRLAWSMIRLQPYRASDRPSPGDDRVRTVTASTTHR